MPGDKGRKPARRDDWGVVSELLDHTAHKPVGAIGLAIDDARLQGLLGVAPDGVMVSATTSIQPITAALSTEPYLAEATIASLDERLNECAAAPARFVLVDDEAVLSQVGNRKALNTVLLAFALKTGHLPLSLDDLRDAVRACVKPRFVELNLAAIDLVESKE